MITVQQAQPADANALTDIAMIAKQHWGYDSQFMLACAEELKQTAAMLQDERRATWTAKVDESLAGFFAIQFDHEPSCELEALFVLPQFMGLGVGQHLFGKAVTVAQSNGYQAMTIVSDPYALNFYLKQGAQQQEMIASQSIPGRMLPLLQLPL
ncbi:MAG: GNAT family N-acetyltransferase [Aestuariibacter sp.]